MLSVLSMVYMYKQLVTFPSIYIFCVLSRFSTNLDSHCIYLQSCIQGPFPVSTSHYT